MIDYTGPETKYFKCLKICSFLFFVFLNLKFLFIIYLLCLFLAVLGLRLCVRAFSSCGERGPPSIAVRGPVTTAASLVAEQRLQTLRLSSCGSRAQPLRGMWDPPRPGPEPVSPALAGRLPTTAPPGKPRYVVFYQLLIVFCLAKSNGSDHDFINSNLSG